VARFDGGTISSDGGAFLLRQVDKRLNLLARFGRCFLDGRNQALVEHDDVRPARPISPGKLKRPDNEYKRCGTANAPQ
jgi:hypothetical protein